MKRTIARLRRELKQYGITQAAIAMAADVDRTMVNKVMNERAVSAKVVATAERLLAEKKLEAVA